MNTQVITKSKRSAKLIALLLTAILIASAIAVNIGNTLAEPNANDIVVQLESESGIPEMRTIEKGQTGSLSAAGLFEAYSTDLDVATVGFTPGSSLGNIRITGVKAGVAYVYYGSKGGMVTALSYQITDSGNVSAYTIKDRGEVYFTTAGVTKDTPVTVTQGNINRIEWSSMNESVAKVAQNGSITSQGIGMTIITGKFTDKWGKDRCFGLLVGVGISMNGGVLGPDPDGNYYRPVGEPPNVYEVVDENGNSLEPEKYVYNEDGDPVGQYEKNRPANKEDGFYYVEDPKGSNIWHKVKGDGTLQDSPALWGGPDRKPGGGDDKEVTKFDDGSYWVHVAQNVWREVTAPTTLGPLTGGGPDMNPVTTPATKIYYHEKDGKYYVGPLGPEDGYDYYYGDKAGGNGTLDSTNDSLFKDDVKYYKDSNGNMTTTKPITDGKGTGVEGRELTKDMTGDTSKWIEIARNGEYSLIMREEFINIFPNNQGNPSFQNIQFTGNNAYSGSVVQTQINKWFTGTGNPTTVLPADARLRSFTVKNTALNAIGGGPATDGYNTGFSKPIAEKDSKGEDTAFILSYGEAAQFISLTYSIDGGSSSPSPLYAQKNFPKLNMVEGTPAYDSMWLRSPGATNYTVSSLQFTGRVYQRLINGELGEAGLIYPALWVHQDIFGSN